jgi:hypothetical protein
VIAVITALEEVKRDAERIAADNEARILKMWGGRNYKKYLDKINLRRKYLNQLYLIYPYIELQAECIDGSRSRLFGFYEDPRLYAPAVHYRILPNEIVFEIDRKDLGELKKVVKMLKTLNAEPFVGFKVVKMLKTLNAEPFVGFSGNRGFHVHLIVAPPKGDVTEFATHPETKRFTQTLYEVLLKMMKSYGVDVEVIDSGVMMSSNHTIRSFYSVNLKGRKWKTPIYGDGYTVWQVSKQLGQRVLEEMREREEREKVDQLIARELNGGGNGVKKRRIAWIEWVLKHPEKITDGRRILLMYAIIPYLINVLKKDPNEVFDVCMDWVRKTPGNDEKGNESEYKALIKHEIKSYVKSGVLPMSRKKFFETFNHVRYLEPLLPKPFEEG